MSAVRPGCEEPTSPNDDRATSTLLRAAPGVITMALATALFAAGHRGINSDTVAYMSITRHWVEVDWSHAVNGYWSPLFSILMIPWDAVGAPLTVGVRVLAVLVAGGTVAALMRLMDTTGANRRTSIATGLAAIPLAAFAAVDTVGPDLLMSMLLLLFVSEYLSDVRRPVLVGLLGGLAFLAKAYALPVVVAFVVAHLAWGVISDSDRTRRGSWRSIGVAAAVLLAIVGCWSAAVSVDAGRATFSTSAEYHRDITSPGSLGNPYRYVGLIEPDHPSAVFGWEDPPAVEIPPRRVDSGAAGSSSGAGRLTRFGDNANDALRGSALGAGSVLFAPFVVAASLAVALRARRRGTPIPARATAVVSLALAAIVHVGGLLVLVVNARYLYFAILLTIAISGHGAAQLIERSQRRHVAIALAVLVLVGTWGRPSVALVRIAQNTSEPSMLDVFRDVDLEGERLATIPVALAVGGGACFEGGCTYLGSPRPDAMLAQLVDADVSLVAVIGDRDVQLPPDSAVLAFDDSARIVVYRIADATSGARPRTER